MNTPSFVLKLNLLEDWNDLQENLSTSNLESFIFKLIKLYENNVFFMPGFDPNLISFNKEFDSIIKELLTIVPLSYFESSEHLFMREWSQEAKLSFEDKLERCAKLWSSSLSKLDPKSPIKGSWDPPLSPLDRMLLEVSLTECLLSPNSFVRERRLFLETNQRIKK